MEKVVFKTGKEIQTYAALLGIHREREIDLKAHCEKTIVIIGDELSKSGRIGFNSNELLQRFVSVAQDEQELTFLACIAGMKIKHFQIEQEKIIPQGLAQILAKAFEM